MKMIKESFILMVVVFASLLLFVGCPQKPNDEEIKKAISTELQSNIPVSWVGNLLGGKNAKINSIEIKEWGSYNKEQKYWPVKVRVVGSAELNDPFNRGKIRQFDKVTEFRFYKDDYDEWKARLSGGMFQ